MQSQDPIHEKMQSSLSGPASTGLTLAVAHAIFTVSFVTAVLTLVLQKRWLSDDSSFSHYPVFLIAYAGVFVGEVIELDRKIKGISRKGRGVTLWLITRWVFALACFAYLLPRAL